MLSFNNGPKPSLSIKEMPVDFIVKEITKSLKILDIDSAYTPEELGFENGVDFAIFGMQKKNWNTIQALEAIAKASGKGKKSVNFAGTKDRRAVSVQLCSIKGVAPEKLLSLNISDIKINFAFGSSDQVKMGQLEGNNFLITARGAKETDMGSILKSNMDLNGLFPNYFGGQRFGSRDNNVGIGLSLLKGDFESAAMEFLTGAMGEIDSESKEARIRLKSEMDFTKAMEYFPKHLKYERKVISYLSEYGPNYRSALRQLPRQLLMMFVHSVESKIFNRVVEELVENREPNIGIGSIVCEVDGYGFPDYSKVSRASSNNEPGKLLLGNIIGYETKVLSEMEKQAMEEYGITLESFRSKQIPELRAKGALRAVFAPYKDFSASYADGSIKLGFSLPSGSYATVLLSEFMSYKANSATLG